VTDTRRYRVREFAQLAGVTVRTLHHYDRLGLLRARRDESGFRVYTSTDLERLEEIIALRFIGLPLQQIRAIVSGDDRELGSALLSQISALQEKKRRIEIAIETIRSAEAALRSGERPCLKHIIEVIEMQNDHGWILQHFTNETRTRVQERLATVAPETWTELQRHWSALARDIQLTADTDASAPEAQELLSRWENLIRQTTGEDQELVRGLKSLYSDRQNWPEPIRGALISLFDERILDFVRRAVAARAS
jgi:DNA-binding transcriptional MerR regulator